MGAANSTMKKLGSAAPKFALPNVVEQNKVVELDAALGKPLLIMFICNHCPYVIHMIEPLVRIANQAQRDGFAVYAISSNDEKRFPQDSPSEMAKFAERYDFEFPYLFDQSQVAAKAFTAACTPDFFIYDGQHKLVYRGQFDASRPGNGVAVTGTDLSAGLLAASNNDAPPANQVPSIGCSIKWLLGNEPDYF